MISLLLMHTVFAGSKVSLSGQYLPFPGVTVISMVADRSFCNELHDALAKHADLLDYMALLPADSYHMTTLNLFVEDQTEGEGLAAFLRRRTEVLFKPLGAYIEKNGFSPRGKIVGVTDYGNMLKIQLPEMQAQTLQHSAVRFHLDSKLPGSWHVTLGYYYRELTEAQRVHFYSIVRTELEALLVKRRSRQCDFTRPHLTSFQDMTAYSLWDGETSPF